MPTKLSQLTSYYTNSQENSKNGELLNQTSTTFPIVSTVQTVTESVKNWERRLKRGSNATGQMIANWDSVRLRPWYASVVYNLASDNKPRKDVYEDKRRSSTGLTGTLPGFPSELSSAEHAARSQLFQNVISTRRKLQGGVIIGEIAETMRMLRAPSDRLVDSLFSLAEAYRSKVYRRLMRNRSRKVKLQEANRLVRDTYLEYAYGWKPLIADTKDAAKALADRKYRLQNEIEFVRSEGEVLQSTTGTSRNSVGQYRVISNSKRKRQDKIKYLAALKGYTPSPLKRTMADLGFSPEDFIPTVYNLIPYSFIIDYFTNTGEVLDAWSHRSIDYHWGQRTIIADETISVTQTDDTLAWQDGLGHELLGHLFVAGMYKRSVGTITRERIDVAELQPKFHFEIPGVRQSVNMLALLNPFRRLQSLFPKVFK